MASGSRVGQAFSGSDATIVLSFCALACALLCMHLRHAQHCLPYPRSRVTHPSKLPALQMRTLNCGAQIYYISDYLSSTVDGVVFAAARVLSRQTEQGGDDGPIEWSRVGLVCQHRRSPHPAILRLYISPIPGACSLNHTHSLIQTTIIAAQYTFLLTPLATF